MPVNELSILTLWSPNEFYTKEWLLKIQNSISRNLTIPHKHVCLTNEKLDHCDTIPFDNNHQPREAYWLKIQLYRKHPKLQGPCLYFDLDMVIINSLDIMVTNLLNNTNNRIEIWGAKSPFVNEQATSPKHFFNSSILFWRKNPTHLWERFITSTPKGWHIHVRDEHTHGDQAFVATFAKIGFVDDFCPKDFIKGIKTYNEEKTSIIFFAGKRKPNSYTHNPIIEKNWRI